MTSFGHLIWAERQSPSSSSTASAAASAPNERELGNLPLGRWPQQHRHEDCRPRGSDPGAAEPPPSRGLVVSDGDRALGIVWPEQQLRRLALVDLDSGLSDHASLGFLGRR